MIRFLSFLLLAAIVVAMGMFVYQNSESVPVAFSQWAVVLPMSLLIGAVYVLGMISGWSLIGMLKRSVHRLTDDPR